MKLVNGELKITTEWLRKEGACKEAVDKYAPLLNGGKPLAACIKALDRADWLLWLLWHAGAVNIRQLVKLACVAGRLSLRHVPVGENRPQLAYESAERWTLRPTRENAVKAVRACQAAEAVWAAEAVVWAARAAANAAWAAAQAARADAEAAGAAEAVVWAAEAIGWAARAAAEAAANAAWACGASAWAAAGTAKIDEHRKLCDAIRRKLNNTKFKALLSND